MVGETKKTLWEALSAPAKEFLKTTLLETIKTTTLKELTHKFANLLVEVAGGMYEESEEIWQPLLNLIFEFVNSPADLQVDAALQIFNGLFHYIIDHLNKFKADLGNIFKKTLNHNTLDIRLAALQAVSNYLQTVESTDTKAFQELIPDMYNVIRAAAQEDDEVVLQDALIEFNEIAEIEPRFFKSRFSEIFQNTLEIVNKSDFTNPMIRQQPVEFYVTMIERVPSIVSKDAALLQNVIEQIFKLMIDVDADIEADWMRPKEGFKENDDGEEGEDNVNFGKGCIDKIISAVGDATTLPILGTIVTNTVANTEDWRYKNAGLMAFSQVGEYLDDVQKLAAMLPIVVENLQNQCPKVRYASLHCIGQLSDDMSEEFQEAFGKDVLPALIQVLADQVPRVSAHACSAITNFMDGAAPDLVEQHMNALSQQLGALINGGISIQKENAVTALASSIVAIKEKFDAHFNETMALLFTQLESNPGPDYRQLRAQIVEAITLISSAVSSEVFMPQSDKIITAMIQIQQSNLEASDPQRSYLLSAWQRICLIMKGDFCKYLPQILPHILSMATLRPEMGIEGQGGAELTDVLQEVRNDEGAKKANIMTDEIEEKDTAIQMLVVFLDELGAGFAPYIEQVSEIMMGLSQFYASNNIRTSAAEALASLAKCQKTAEPADIAKLHALAKRFTNNLIEAMETETETECMINQAQAFKEIMEEAGENLIQADSVDALAKKVLEFISESENRITQNETYEKEGLEGDEEDQLDEEDIHVLKEENKCEADLQIHLAEILGVVFKTHRPLAQNLARQLLEEVLPEAAKDPVKRKQKFILFLLDDMVEFLGPDFLGPAYPKIVTQICGYAASKYAAIRQAAVYGLGMAAQHGGAAFQASAVECLTALKGAIELPLDAKTREKKSKLNQYNYAKENAISALGKILKYQPTTPDASTLLEHWLTLMPLTHDFEEAKIMNDFLADGLLRGP